MDEVNFVHLNEYIYEFADLGENIYDWGGPYL